LYKEIKMKGVNEIRFFYNEKYYEVLKFNKNNNVFIVEVKVYGQYQSSEIEVFNPIELLEMFQKSVDDIMQIIGPNLKETNNG